MQRTSLFTLIADEHGATALEYGLLGALIAAIIMAAVTSLGTAVQSIFSSVATTINMASGGS